MGQSLRFSMASSGPSSPPQRSTHSQVAALVEVFVEELAAGDGVCPQQFALEHGPGRRSHRGVVIVTAVSGAADFEGAVAAGPLAESVAAEADDSTHDTNVKANPARQVRTRDNSRGRRGSDRRARQTWRESFGPRQNAVQPRRGEAEPGEAGRKAVTSSSEPQAKRFQFHLNVSASPLRTNYGRFAIGKSEDSGRRLSAVRRVDSWRYGRAERDGQSFAGLRVSGGGRLCDGGLWDWPAATRSSSWPPAWALRRLFGATRFLAFGRALPASPLTSCRRNCEDCAASSGEFASGLAGGVTLADLAKHIVGLIVQELQKLDDRRIGGRIARGLGCRTVGRAHDRHLAAGIELCWRPRGLDREGNLAACVVRRDGRIGRERGVGGKRDGDAGVTPMVPTLASQFGSSPRNWSGGISAKNGPSSSSRRPSRMADRSAASAVGVR